MIVRMCYERVKSIITRKLTAPFASRGSGLIFSGGPGNSKTWLSLYIVWLMIREGRTVIYEICQKGIVYVIPFNGPIRMVAVPASLVTVFELSFRDAVHIYDSKANSRSEPARSYAFLIMFTARNLRNYFQTYRLYGMDRYCIPTYEEEELLLYCELFGVTREEVLQRCAEIGPSIRSILVNNYKECKAYMIEMAYKINTEQLDSYISNTFFKDRDDITAFLMLAIVNEHDYKNPDDAYKDENIQWELASTYLTKIILKRTSSNPTAFVHNFMTNVHSKGLKEMNGVVGNYFKVIVDKFLSQGNFLKSRRLWDPTTQDPIDLTFRRMIGSQNLLKIEESNINHLEIAFQECTKLDTLYCFNNKTFPVGFATNHFVVNFLVTNSSSYLIPLKAIRMICHHVRTQYGPHVKVFLIFVVPEEMVTSEVHWKYSQPFYDYEIVLEGGESRRRKTRSNYHELSEAIQAELKNLEQHVVCYTEHNNTNPNLVN